MRSIIFVSIVLVLSVVLGDVIGHRSVSSSDVQVRSKFSRLLQLLKKGQVDKRQVTAAECTTYFCSFTRYSEPRCLPSIWVCDGGEDCNDGEDEANCGASAPATTVAVGLPTLTCLSDQFKCANLARCIPMRWRCDGDADCSDRSDEANCETPTTTVAAAADACSSDQFKCASLARCIPLRWRCDGDADCSDRSDEANCGASAAPATTVAVGLPTLTCLSDQFKCANLARCIPMRWRCDGDADCSDRSDEANCATTTTTTTAAPTTPLSCASDQFKCANLERCIPKRWVCDGGNDCSDKSDEANCDSGDDEEDDYDEDSSGSDDDSESSGYKIKRRLTSRRSKTVKAEFSGNDVLEDIREVLSRAGKHSAAAKRSAHAYGWKQR